VSTVVARVTPKTAKDQRGPATGYETSGASGPQPRRDSRARACRSAGTPRSLACLSERERPATVLLVRCVRRSRCDGETTLEVQASAEGVEQFQTARRLSRCDGQSVQLFRKRWDFARHRFVPAAAELPAHAAVGVQARRGGAPAGKPSSGFFFSAASSSSGADGDAARLKPPAAVNDDNPDTVWIGDGEARGQTLTARSSAGFPIIGMRFCRATRAARRAIARALSLVT